MRHPLLPPLAGLVVGIAAADLFPSLVSPGIATASLAVAVVAVFRATGVAYFGAIFLAFICAGSMAADATVNAPVRQDDVSSFAGSRIVVQGTVAARPIVTSEGARLVVAAERVYRGRRFDEVTGRMLLFVGNGVPDVVTGDRIRVMTTPRIPQLLGLPGEFDYRRFLAWQGIGSTGTVRDAGDILLMEAGAEHPLFRRADLLARDLAAAIRRAVPGEEGGVLCALILGDRGTLDARVADSYTAAGVNHILSISGFHMAVVAAAVFQAGLFLCRRIPVLPLRINLRKTLMILTVPVLGLYLLLVGAEPAALRSVIMIAACIAALAAERETDGIDMLMFAAVVILALQPGALFNISFQLSFLALWGLMVLTPLFLCLLPQPKGWRGIAVSQVAASLAAIAATFVPVLFYFQRGSFAGILANLVVVPLIGYGSVVTGFVGILVALASPVAAVPFFQAAGFLIYLAGKLIALFASLPASPAFPVSRTQFLLVLLLLAAITFLRQRPRRAAVMTLSAVCAMTVVPSVRKPERTLRTTFFSLGQSESSLVNLPDGKTMLIDGGGSLFDGGRDVGEKLLLPALRHCGVSRIDYMVLTHPHPDHLKGLVSVAAALPVGEFWEGPRGGGSDYARLKETLRAKNVPVRQLTGMSHLEAGGAGVDILASGADGGTGEASMNDASTVMRLTEGRTAILFTGDIGFAREEELLRRPDLLRCTVLKVPHHGSRWSSSDRFLAATGARIALISAGRGNAFHLPASEALARLAKHRMSVYRTDLDGTITVVADGSVCRVGNSLECQY